MLNRTIYISNPFHLSIRNEHIILEPKEESLRAGELTAEDVGFLVLDHPSITFSLAVIELCARHNVAVIFCGKTYMPSSMLFHLDTHGVQSERFRAQLEASEPLRKQLWAQTIKAKIRNQSGLLGHLGNDASDIEALARQVKSGDGDNHEAQAARRYWPRLLGPGFVRERHGAPPNHALNYGYTILRAGVARALCGRGLFPLLGIHHQNRYNHFALADDIMEPYRIWVDYLTIRLMRSGALPDELDRASKADLLKVLTMDACMDGQLTNLMQALDLTATSLAQCFEGQISKLRYPDFLETIRK
ncbi:MAG: type II CRISPR-associated endonuclease Cas1 [Flavobacteriales bacterium]